MEWWQTISLALVFIVGLNWLLVGLFRFDLVAAVAGGVWVLDRPTPFPGLFTSS